MSKNKQARVPLYKPQNCIFDALHIRIAGRLQTLFSYFYCHGVHQRGKTRVLKNATWFPFDRGAGGRGSRAIRAYPIYMGRFSIRGFPYSDLFSEGDDVD